jgi:hypothetical protein
VPPGQQAGLGGSFQQQRQQQQVPPSSRGTSATPQFQVRLDGCIIHTMQQQQHASLL